MHIKVNLGTFHDRCRFFATDRGASALHANGRPCGDPGYAAAVLMNGVGVFTFASEHRNHARDLAMRKRTILFIFATLLLAGAASAHHGWGSYDPSKVFTISAPVETLSWADPHARIMLKYEGATWEATLAPLSRMQARGLSEDLLKPGTPVIVLGYPSTRTQHEMRAERITVAGKTVELR
jgi:hypothetical protein